MISQLYINKAKTEVMYKKILLLVAICNIFAIAAYSQKSASYVAKGYKYTYNVVVQDSLCFLIVSFESGKNTFSAEPILMLKTFNDEVISLQGKTVEGKTSTYGIMSSAGMIPISVNKSMAQFQIRLQDIEKLNNGISKIRISTIPQIHEKEFKKDKIGKKLYKMFGEATAKSRDF